MAVLRLTIDLMIDLMLLRAIAPGKKAASAMSIHTAVLAHFRGPKMFDPASSQQGYQIWMSYGCCIPPSDPCCFLETCCFMRQLLDLAPSMGLVPKLSRTMKRRFTSCAVCHDIYKMSIMSICRAQKTQADPYHCPPDKDIQCLSAFVTACMHRFFLVTFPLSCMEWNGNERTFHLHAQNCAVA